MVLYYLFMNQLDPRKRTYDQSQGQEESRVRQLLIKHEIKWEEDITFQAPHYYLAIASLTVLLIYSLHSTVCSCSGASANPGGG